MSGEYGISSNSDLLLQIARSLGAYPPPREQWLAATVVLYSTNSEVVAAQVIHVQDVELGIAENALIGLAISALRRHLGDTSDQ